jgi:lysophospholipase L1-like esterase
VGTYVALGSSFASGPGIEPQLHPGCGRSGSNYAHLVARRLGLDLVDVTCGGATVANVLDSPQALLTARSVPPQLDALTGDAELVTVTVGGNDVDYLLTLLRCSARADPDGVPAEARAFFATPVDRDAVRTALDALPGRLAGLVTAVRDRAPEARVVLVDYLTLVPSQPSPAVPMDEDDRAFCAEVQTGLEAATAEAASATGADLVQAGAASRDHHAGAAEPWVTGWVFGDLVGGVVPYHPNAQGMRAVAGLVGDLLQP